MPISFEMAMVQVLLGFGGMFVSIRMLIWLGEHFRRLMDAHEAELTQQTGTDLKKAGRVSLIAR